MGELKDEMKGLWELLNHHGIYTNEDLAKAEKKLRLDIGIFTTDFTNIIKTRKEIKEKVI